MREFYESHFGEEGLENEQHEDLLTAVGEKFSELRNTITNDGVAGDLEDILGVVETHYDTAYNQEDWDELLRSVQGVLERIQEGDEDAAEAALEDIKNELETIKAKIVN